MIQIQIEHLLQVKSFSESAGKQYLKGRSFKLTYGLHMVFIIRQYRSKKKYRHNFTYIFLFYLRSFIIAL
jgi:hypothetical protein